MMKRITRILLAVAIMISGFGVAAVIPSTSASAACTSKFLTFPAWYDGVIDTSTCELKPPDVNKNGGGLSTFIFRIVLNVISIVLQIIGYAAAGFLIYGGFKYLTSAGSADRVASGKKTILNALIGLTISFMSVAIVTLVANNITAPAASGSCSGSGTQINADCVGVVRADAATTIDGILKTVYYAGGVIAVVVIIISGIFYVISQGDPGKTKRAKDGILYAVVGLVLIMMAFVITNFVIGRL